MSTTSRSQAPAPWTSTGPLSMCAWVRSTSRTSLAVVVAELGVGPLAALDPELAAGLDRGGGQSVGVPAVVAGDSLVAHGLGLVDAEDHIWHVRSLPFLVRGRYGRGRGGVAGSAGAAAGPAPARDRGGHLWVVGAGLLPFQGAGERRLDAAERQGRERRRPSVRRPDSGGRGRGGAPMERRRVNGPQCGQQYSYSVMDHPCKKYFLQKVLTSRRGAAVKPWSG